VSSVLDGITFILRGVPFYVQLLIAYFVLPNIVGINVSAFSAALLSLGLCSASYVSQIVRGGINAIPFGQWEAAKVLGCSTTDTVRYIVIPQMLKIVLPALIGECDQLLKSTSIVSAIGVLELTGAGRNIIAQEMNPLTIYTVLAIIYLIISALLALFSTWLEAKMQTQ
jgi:ABC-type amino acid transport system permease subunit